MRYLHAQGAEILIAPHGSPFCEGKSEERRAIALQRVREKKLPLIILNRVGGQDELVFDGDSFGLHADESFAFELPCFEENLAILTWKKKGATWVCEDGLKAPRLEKFESLYTACTLGLGDYVRGNGFESVVLGLSGGVDSALVASMCVDALGKKNVHAVMLPSRYTSKHSIEDAAACANNLGIRHEVIPIEPVFEAALETLQPIFTGKEADVTEENLQSRLRGTLLMALSNKFGAMLISTGNKSEMAVGYATLYGDMNGGFNPIKDLYKTQIYELARWRNRVGKVIPERILTKAPTAELRENQTDQDALPPYDILDAILERLIERNQSARQIVDEGFEPKTVRKIETLLARAEYKRRQAPPGVKLSSHNFGRGRRYPITNGWRDPGLSVKENSIVRLASSPCYAEDF